MEAILSMFLQMIVSEIKISHQLFFQFCFLQTPHQVQIQQTQHLIQVQLPVQLETQEQVQAQAEAVQQEYITSITRLKLYHTIQLIMKVQLFLALERYQNLLSVGPGFSWL